MSYVLGTVSSSELYTPTDAEVVTFGQVPSSTGLSQQDFGKVMAGAIAGTVQGNTGIPTSADDVIFRLSLLSPQAVEKLSWTMTQLGENAVSRGGNLTSIGQHLASLAQEIRGALSGAIIEPLQSAFHSISAGISKLGVDRLLSVVINSAGLKDVLMSLATKVFDTLKQALGGVLTQLTAIVGQVTSVVSSALPYIGAGISFLSSLAQTITQWFARFQGTPGFATDYAGDGLNLYLMFLSWSDQNKGTKYLSDDVVQLMRERGSSITVQDLTTGWVTAFDPVYQEATVWNSAIPDMFAPIRALDLGPAIVPGPDANGKFRLIPNVSWPMFRDVFKNDEFRRYIRDKAPRDWVQQPSVIGSKQTSVGAADSTIKHRDAIDLMYGCQIYASPELWPGHEPSLTILDAVSLWAGKPMTSIPLDFPQGLMPKIDACYGGGPDAPLLPFRQANWSHTRMLRLAACYVHGTSACVRGAGEWKPPVGKGTAGKAMVNAYFDDNSTWYDLGYGGGYTQGTRRTNWWGYYDIPKYELYLIPPFVPPSCLEYAMKRGGGIDEGWAIREAFHKVLKQQPKFAIGTEPQEWLPQTSPSPTVTITPRGATPVVDSKRTIARTDPQKSLQQDAKRTAAQQKSILKSAARLRSKASSLPFKIALGVGIVAVLGVGSGYVVSRKMKKP